MKYLLPLVFSAAAIGALYAQAPTASQAPAAKLVSNVYDWDKLQPSPLPTGERRMVFDGPTTTVDRLHCHISTLNPGERSGLPLKHLQEEIVIVKEGTLEANYDGTARTAGPGSVIFLASGATTFLRNPGKIPVTYTVINYFTPLTPRN
jgi:XRE family transcriptional regulator, regulator of sulfur utilization